MEEKKEFTSDQTISLELILSGNLQDLIRGEVDAFVKGLAFRKPSGEKYKLYVGYIKLPYENVLDDNEIFNVIRSCVTNFYNMQWHRIISKTRKKEVIFARQLAQSLASKFTDWSLREIGQQIGGVDHATVLNSKKSIREWVTTDRTKAKEYGILVSKVQATINTAYELMSKKS